MTCKQCGLEKARGDRRQIDAATIRRVASMTNRNQHTEARITLARAVGATRLVQAYQKIHRFQMRVGYLPHPQGAQRSKLDKDLFRLIRAKFTNSREIDRAL